MGIQLVRSVMLVTVFYRVKTGRLCVIFIVYQCDELDCE